MYFDLQIRAIHYAIKELNRELVKAQETRDVEWIKDTENHIKNLNDAVEVIRAMKALKAVIS